MAQYYLRQEALNDLQKIAHYTNQHWGSEQRNIYLRELAERFQWLGVNPNLGKRRQDIKEGYYCYPQGAHLIFYLVREGAVEIIRILHKHMDVEYHLSQP